MATSTAPATGSRGQVAFALEDTFGVYKRPTHIIEFTSESLSAEEETIRSEGIKSDRGYHSLIQGNLSVGGDVSFEASPDGFGLIFHQALGDYVKVENVDAGIRSRVASGTNQTVPTVDSNTTAGNEIYLLADESTVEFPTTDTNLAIFYRDASDTLSVDDNTASGHAYEGHNTYGVSRVNAVTDPDTSYTGYSATDVVSITVDQVYDLDGNAYNLPGNTAGGILEFGADRTQVRYFEVDTSGTGTTFYLDPAQVTPSGSNLPVVGDLCIVKATVTFASTLSNMAAGSWIAYWHTDYSGVWSHMHDRGVRLPVGLTIEVDRDAAIFLYTGQRVSTLTLNFEAGQIVTGTASFVGQKELSVGRLHQDAMPGDTEIFIEDKYEAPFPTTAQISAGSGTATITIGERTDITYTTKDVDYNGEGITRLSGIPASGDNAIDRVAPKGTNVDSRTSIAHSDAEEGSNEPLTVFESVLYLDGFYEEVLSASITLTNNMSEDKQGLGSRFILALPENRTEVEASLTVEFDDGKLYNRFLGGDFFSLDFRCVATGDGSEIGATGVFSQMHVFLPSAKFDGSTPNIDGDEYIQHDMPCMTKVDDDLNTREIVVFFVNPTEFDVDDPSP